MGNGTFPQALLSYKVSKHLLSAKSAGSVSKFSIGNVSAFLAALASRGSVVVRYGVGVCFTGTKCDASFHAEAGLGMSSPYVISILMYVFRNVRCSAGYLLALTSTGLI